MEKFHSNGKKFSGKKLFSKNFPSETNFLLIVFFYYLFIYLYFKDFFTCTITITYVRHFQIDATINKKYIYI